MVLLISKITSISTNKKAKEVKLDVKIFEHGKN